MNINGAVVLVTGANGYVALWIIQYLLQSGYAVRGTVRSESKESHARRYFEDLGLGQKLEFVVVDDITKVGSLSFTLHMGVTRLSLQPRSFDEAVVGVDAIVHTASPFHLSPKDVNGWSNAFNCLYGYSCKATQTFMTQQSKGLQGSWRAL